MQDSKEFTVTTHKDDSEFLEAYLKKNNGIYSFYVLGKNGEPEINASVDFTFGHKIYTRLKVN